MYTRKIFGCGLIAVVITSIFALSLTGCDQPADPPIVTPIVTLTGITAVYTDTNPPTVIYTFTPLNSLKDRLTVTAQYSDGSEATLNAEDYTLSSDPDPLEAGEEAAITVSYTEDSIEKTDTFNVDISSATLESIAVVYVPGDATIYTSTPLDSLKQYLTVTAAYSDQNESELAESEYTLSGTLTVGTPTITVHYGEESEGFEVTVVAVALTGITATYTGTATIYPTTLLDTLKQYLTVTAQYNDGSEKTLNATDYIFFDGILTVGPNTITVSYTEDSIEETDTFNITVTAASGGTITWMLSQKGGVPVAGSTPTASTTAIVITFTGAVNLTDADIVIGGAAERKTVELLSSSVGNTVWEVPVSVTGSDNATVTVSKDGVAGGAKTVMVYKQGVAPTENPASGVTTYVGERKIVFSTTTSSDNSGTYTMYRKGGWDRDTGWATDEHGYHIWIQYEQGDYTWSSQTITLIPTTVYNGEGNESLTRAEADEKMLDWIMVDLNRYLAGLVEEGMSEAEAEAALLEELNREMMGTSYTTLDGAYAAYAIACIEWFFATQTYTYDFIGDAGALFLQEALPPSVGTDELDGKTFHGWNFETNQQDTNQTYEFTNGTFTETYNGSVTRTGSYSYSSTQKLVWLKTETVNWMGGPNPFLNPEEFYTSHGASQTGDAQYFPTLADYQMAMTAQSFGVSNRLYDLDKMAVWK